MNKIDIGLQYELIDISEKYEIYHGFPNEALIRPCDSIHKLISRDIE